MAMRFPLKTLFMFLVILGLIVGLIILALRKGISSVKLMMLGINITLFGGIIVLNTNTDFISIGYLISFLGLIISVLGLVKKD